MQVKVGDLLKYVPTATVGKVTDIRERDGKTWVRLDFTDLYYDSAFLTGADPSEYIAVSYKEREDHDNSREVLDELRKETGEVDITEFMPSGGG